MSDVNERVFAVRVLDTAEKVITTERGTQHGDAESSFQMIADLWNTYITHKEFRRAGTIVRPSITPADVAEMMSLLKKARKVYGSVDPDHYVDDVGYTAIGASLAGAAPGQRTVNTAEQGGV